MAGYVVGRLLGVGGSADVWSATRAVDGHPVAVKVVGRQRVSDLYPSPAPVDVGRELAVLRGLRHPHVVQLIDDIPLADGRTALVLELVRGGSLARVVRARGHLTCGEVGTVLTTLGTTLAELHRLGLTHGDLSPGNVLFHADGRPMLSDVGLAQIAGNGPTDVGGTTGFMDPAILTGGPVGPATDIYGLGTLGWFGLTGAAPGSALTRPALRTIAAAPAALIELIESALDPDPGRRPSAAELAHASHLAAPAVPVRLAGDVDPVDELTHRIRALAAADLPEPSWSARSARSARSRALGRLMGRLVRRRPVRTALMLPAVVVCLAAALVGAAHPAPHRATAVAGPVDPWPAVVAALTTARAAAFEGAAVSPEQFDLAGTDAWRNDQAGLDRLRAARLRYRGLRLEPAEIRALTATPGRAELRVTYRTAAYDVVDASGAVLQHRPATAPTTVQLALVRTPEGWRVAAARPG
jgi:eukaryotic-like serine/threonine-protein kinase